MSLSGLSETITVPANSTVYVATDGGGTTTSNQTNLNSIFDVGVFIDGSLPPAGFFRRVFCPNATDIAFAPSNWSFGAAFALSPGPHTIDVRARLFHGSPAHVSGNSDSAVQCTLTVMFLKQ